MTRAQAFAWLMLLALGGLLSCHQEDGVQRRAVKSGGANAAAGAGQPLLITIGTKPFAATLADNAATKQFRKLLPLRLTMQDLNGNQKRADLATRLPVELAKAQQIHIGDLLLSGPDTLILFYQTFPTGYRYTPLARINDPTNVAAAVGQGPVEVTIALPPE